MKPSAPITPEQALTRLQDLCMRGEYCRYELRQKLFRWGIRNADADEVLAQLEADRFFCDDRFARAFASTHFISNRWGIRKIALALAAKRIARATIEEAVGEIAAHEDYEDTLRQLASALRSRFPEPLSYEDRTRIFRTLLARGFESELISKVLKC